MTRHTHTFDEPGLGAICKICGLSGHVIQRENRWQCQGEAPKPADALLAQALKRLDVWGKPEN